MLASVWYMVRVLLAASLMRGRSVQAKLGQAQLGQDDNHRELT